MDRIYYIEQRVKKIFRQVYIHPAKISEANKLITEYKALTNWDETIKTTLI